MKVVLTVLIATLASTAVNAACELPRADVDAIRAAASEYVAAWLANDEERVMGLLASDAVLLPPPGAEPKVGRQAARRFWFAKDAPAFIITAFDQDVGDVVGCGELAVLRGRQKILEWNYDGKKYRNLGSNYVSTYKKETSGDWRLLWQIWNTVGTEEVKP